ncbi:MAG: glycosyltransferase family 8 protein [Bacilli bacterium]|nr:glycosyltransferase family 8 protein [Bacilli bacterium]
MNFVYTFDNNFVPQAATSICSACVNNKEKINFYVLSFGITEENKEKLKNMVEKYNHSINFIEITNLDSFFSFKINTTGWKPIVLARLLIDKLLPKNMERVLYIDGDTIVRNDISDFYHMNLNGKTIGMSIEPTIDKKRIEVLHMGNYPYCNAGVLLIDLKKWRKNNVGENVIDYYRSGNGKFFAHDQDSLNGYMKKEIKIISPKYNYYNIFDQYSYKFLSKIMRPIDYSKYVSEKDYNEAKKNPSIIHYLGEERPWRKGNTHKYRKDYKKYLSMTDWHDTEDEKGWTLYFICWKIFNIFTKPFPGIRLGIINSLIPTFMKIRANKLKNKK